MNKSRYALVPSLYKKMFEAGMCAKWYAPRMVARLIKNGQAVIPKAWSGRIRMTEAQMDSFITAFSPGGKMRWP